MNDFLAHITDPTERKRAIDAAFAKHEAEQNAELADRTTPEERILIVSDMVRQFADDIEAMRIREGIYGDRIPQAHFDNPSPKVKAALIEVGRWPADRDDVTDS